MVIAVVTNIDYEHVDAYGSFTGLCEAFGHFADRVPFYGAVVACIDNQPVKEMIGRLTRRVITYGFAEDADVRGLEPVTDGTMGRCLVEYQIRGVPNATGRGELFLPVPGSHNLQNALAAVAVGIELGVPFERVQTALAEFRGAERRYQLLGEVRGVRVIDDYGHHPTEIAAVLRAAKDGHPFRLVAVFQPHRYTRTRDLLTAFGAALSAADLVVLTDIYSAGEPPLAGVTLDALADAVRPAVGELHVVPRIDDVPAEVARLARPGDLVVTLGAGSIGTAGGRILSALAEVEARR